MCQKQHGFLLTDGLVEELEVEVPQGHASSDGNRLPVEVVLQNWCFSARRPRAAAVWTLTQPAFVDEDDRAAFLLGFFLTAGHVLCFHSAIASSFRSSARPLGRCGLQFNCRRIFQT